MALSQPLVWKQLTEKRNRTQNKQQEPEKHRQPRKRLQGKQRAKQRLSEGRLKATKTARAESQRAESDAARDQTTSESSKHRVHPQEAIALRDLTDHPHKTNKVHLLPP